METLLYSFGANSGDGGYPTGVAMDSAGNLFGTTYFGGAYSAGTVFELAAGVTEKILYSFKEGKDGGQPQAPVVLDKSDNVYGVTQYGGNDAECGGFGCGTVFKVMPTGKETVLHTFSGDDGADPVEPLLSAGGGVFYGTTSTGGGMGCFGGGCGTVFKFVK